MRQDIKEQLRTMKSLVKTSQFTIVEPWQTGIGLGFSSRTEPLKLVGLLVKMIDQLDDLGVPQIQF